MSAEVLDLASRRKKAQDIKVQPVPAHEASRSDAEVRELAMETANIVMSVLVDQTGHYELTEQRHVDMMCALHKAVYLTTVSLAVDENDDATRFVDDV